MKFGGPTLDIKLFFDIGYMNKIETINLHSCSMMGAVTYMCCYSIIFLI